VDGGENSRAQNKTSRTQFESPGRLLISPPPSAAQEQCNPEAKIGKWPLRASGSTSGLGNSFADKCVGEMPTRQPPGTFDFSGTWQSPIRKSCRPLKGTRSVPLPSSRHSRAALSGPARRLALGCEFSRAKQNAPDSIWVLGRLLISPPPSAARLLMYSWPLIR